MKLERLISIIYRLLNNEIVSASELAAKYKVSQRTIYRDIDIICAAGIPVVSYQGVNGGYGIMEAYKMDKSLLGSYDVSSLVTVLNSLSKVFNDDRAAETIHRLQTVENGDRAPTMTMDIGSWRAYNDFLRLLRTAIMDRFVVKFEYINAKNERAARVVEPVNLSYKFDTWYLYGYCRTRKDYREFKLSRIAELDSTEEKFHNKHEARNEDSARYSGGGERTTEVVLRVSADSLAQSLDTFSGAEKSFNEDGSLTLVLRVFRDYRDPRDSHYDWIVSRILSFGASIEVIEPPELRRYVKERIEVMLERYRE
jgi:predicted DNA-binding transcriptional regulator YafY